MISGRWAGPSAQGLLARPGLAQPRGPPGAALPSVTLPQPLWRPLRDPPHSGRPSPGPPAQPWSGRPLAFLRGSPAMSHERAMGRRTLSRQPQTGGRLSLPSPRQGPAPRRHTGQHTCQHQARWKEGRRLPRVLAVGPTSTFRPPPVPGRGSQAARRPDPTLRRSAAPRRLGQGGEPSAGGCMAEHLPRDLHLFATAQASSWGRQWSPWDSRLREPVFREPSLQGHPPRTPCAPHLGSAPTFPTWNRPPASQNSPELLLDPSHSPLF